VYVPATYTDALDKASRADTAEEAGHVARRLSAGVHYQVVHPMALPVESSLEGSVGRSDGYPIGSGVVEVASEVNVGCQHNGLPRIVGGAAVYTYRKRAERLGRGDFQIRRQGRKGQDT